MGNEILWEKFLFHFRFKLQWDVGKVNEICHLSEFIKYKSKFEIEKFRYFMPTYDFL
jgi:hypothetical protein